MDFHRAQTSIFSQNLQPSVTITVTTLKHLLSQQHFFVFLALVIWTSIEPQSIYTFSPNLQYNLTRRGSIVSQHLISSVNNWLFLSFYKEFKRYDFLFITRFNQNHYECCCNTEVMQLIRYPSFTSSKTSLQKISKIVILFP